MAQRMNKSEPPRQAEVRLCRLCLWPNFEGLGFHLKQSSHPPHLICTIESNSPAAVSGLRIWDVILAVNYQDMRNKDYHQVQQAIIVTRDANAYVELLVVEEKYYKDLKKQNIKIDSTSATVISSPAMMPADFVNFPKLIPRIYHLRLGRNDITFGFETANGKNDIGVYIQTVYSDSPASHAGLRKSDRIIEINDRNVDKSSSEYISKKLNKANGKGMIKLFVADTQTYEHYVKNNIKFSSTDLNKAISSSEPQRVRKEKNDKKPFMKENNDHRYQMPNDHVLSKYDTIRHYHDDNLLLSSNNGPSKNSGQNNEKPELDGRHFSSSGALNQRKKDSSIGRRLCQAFSSFKNILKQGSRAQAISDNRSLSNHGNYGENKSHYPPSINHGTRALFQCQSDDIKNNYPASTSYNSRSIPNFQDDNNRYESSVSVSYASHSTSKFQIDDIRSVYPAHVNHCSQSISKSQSDDIKNGYPASTSYHSRSLSNFQDDDNRSESSVNMSYDPHSTSKFQNDNNRSDYLPSISHRSHRRSISKCENDDNKIAYPTSLGYSSRGLSKFQDNDNRSDYPASISHKSRRMSNFQDDDTKQNYYSDSLPKRSTLITSTTRAPRKNDYHHTAEDIFTSNAKSSKLRYQSLTDLRKPNQSIRSNTLVADKVTHVSNGTIRICRGDITTQRVDAIVVVSTSDCLKENVLRQAGDSVIATYDREMRQKINRSLCTNGGNLACKRIYFISCPQMSQNADKWIFRKFISKAITLATHDSTTAIQSIAFPAIGCGKYGCNSNFVAKTLIMAVAYELEQQPSLQLDVYFVIQQHQQTIFQAFRNEVITLKNNGSRYKTCRPSDILVHLPPKAPRHQNKREGFVVEKRLLDKLDSKYTKVVNEFWSTMRSQICKEIVRVELIWNERWYKQYMIHKAEFSQRLQNDTEKYLFHGCSEKAANNIIKECFNRSYAGIHGTNYGHGVYFSSKASYSHSYATSNTNGERCMFLAKVLIGKTIVGNSSMKICPIGYDTTTDGSHIYVTYHDAQAFGHYLITYK